MSAFISLSNLSWSKPDGAPLFDDLNLTFGPECTGIVGRNGMGKSTLLRLISGDLRPGSGYLLVAGTFAMMRQEAMAEPDDTVADLLGVRQALALLDRAEAGLVGAEALADADWTLPLRVEAALARFDLSTDPQTLLATLSGGQRSRVALAALILAEPDFLLMDEPTNNLDRDGRQAVLDLVHEWSGGALIVSHDRALLEEMDAIVELTSLGATRYGGNFSAFQQRKNTELIAAERDLAHAEKAGLDAARRAQQATERKARKDSAGQKARRKGGQPKVLMDAAKGRAEASGGAGARLRDARRDAVSEAVNAARENIEVLQPMRMDIPSTGLVSSRTVLRLDNVTGGYDAEKPVIRNFSLAITGPQRIRISGPNGSGKTTLLRLITGQIVPESGKVKLLVPFALLDQNLASLDPAKTLYENFRYLNPSVDVNIAHAALARFGFRASDASRLALGLSGGERLRVGLACALGATPPPMLLILDEPTNHLDLDGVAALESALADYDGALLIISHDEAFVGTIACEEIVHIGECENNEL